MTTITLLLSITVLINAVALILLKRVIEAQYEMLLTILGGMRSVTEDLAAMRLTAGCDCDQVGNLDVACHASDCAWRRAKASGHYDTH
jgi:hypothetical protein